MCFSSFVVNIFNQKFHLDVISIDASIASAFNLPTYSEVVMRTIDPATVALDSVEITFKDQYMGRSEMWRLKTFLVCPHKIIQIIDSFYLCVYFFFHICL